MIEIRLNVENEASKKIALISPAMVRNLDGAVDQASHFIRNTILRKMRQGGKGRIYSRYRGGKNPILHRASAPGQPPASDTGRTIASIRIDTPAQMVRDVGSDVLYAPMLELGTSRMAARPWLKISLDENAGNIQRVVDKAIEDALR